LRQYFEKHNPPERKNLDFLVGLRNKIEHRDLPELDATLYGECQAALLNLEDLLVKEFGPKYAIGEQLAVSLQFSRIIPDEKMKVMKALSSNTAQTVKEYIECFRGGLPGQILNSMKYSFTVFLVPKTVNRESAADAAIEFLKFDELDSTQQEHIQKLNVLIKEKHVPIANLDYLKPGDVVSELHKRVHHTIDIHAHTCAWKHYKVRPQKRDGNPERTKHEYCVYDKVHGDYLYTKAWVEKLTKDLSDPKEYEKVVGKPPKPLKMAA
jgi:hypothetical protein